MPNIQTYPYDDDFMIFDGVTEQYVITEKALLSRGIDIRARLAATSTVSPENVIETVVRTASEMIYQYIHGFNADNTAQDAIIAAFPPMRERMYRALLYQAVYVCNAGNLYLSTKPEERAIAIDELAKGILNMDIPGLGVPITYAGEFARWRQC